LINLTQVAGEAVQAISRGEDGPLALGAIFSSIYVIIPQILPLFIRSYPKVKLHLQEMTISQQISALKEHQIDAGILRGPVFDADLETEILFQEDFVAVVAKNNELSSRTTLSLHEVSQQPLIRVFASANRDYSRRMFSALLDRGYVLNIVQEVSDTHTLIGLVAAGVGVSLVPASLQNIQISQVRYIPLNEETPKTTLELVWHRRNKSPVLLNFIDLVKSIIKEIHPNCLTGLQPYQP
jgi:DNA-binding transcriptional LysR family regulator